MVRIQVCAALLAVFGMAGCGGVDRSARDPVPFAGANISDGIQSAGSGVIPPRTGYVVTDLRISVPADLRISEANSYYPIADIVWRGDPYGDRRAQVTRIFEDAFAQTEPALRDGPQVVAEVDLRRFHALTEKARYTVGGVHSVRFMLTLRDAASGAVLDGPRKIKADMRAAGGARALAEEAAGYTQRIAITRHLAEVLADELALAASPAPDRVVAQTIAAAPDQTATASATATSIKPRHRDRETATLQPARSE